MSEFLSDWLTLREPADLKARNRDVAAALTGRFQLRNSVRVTDLGSGTGANLRATAPLLPKRQAWTLFDRDTALLAAARTALSRWADEVLEAQPASGAELRLRKDHADITVSFAVCDLSTEMARIFDNAPDLVSASAFFDLVSESFIRDLARRVADRRAVFYSALTYNGLQRWSPHRPSDNQMTAAFHRHQMRDKGFGPAAGPLAGAHLSDQFRLFGYSVLEGDSPWVLQRGDRMLIEELARGHALAVAETGAVDLKTIENWVKVARSGAVVGHTDTLAIPG